MPMPTKLYNPSLGSTHCPQGFTFLAVHKSGLRAELCMSPLCFKKFSSGWQSHAVTRCSHLPRHVPTLRPPMSPSLLQPTDFHTISHALPPWVLHPAGLKSTALQELPDTQLLLPATILIPSAKTPTSLNHRLPQLDNLTTFMCICKIPSCWVSPEMTLVWMNSVTWSNKVQSL